MRAADLEIESTPIELATIQPDKRTESTPAITSQDDSTVQHEYPRGIRLVLITVGLILSIFIAALDSTIVCDSHSEDHIAVWQHLQHRLVWQRLLNYKTPRFLSPWGKGYQYFSMKTTFMFAILLFELGNVICASAPSSTVLIFRTSRGGCWGRWSHDGCVSS